MGDAFASLDELIRKMPLYAGPQYSSIVDFEFKWKHWQREVMARIGEGEYAASPKLAKLAAVLAGGEEAIDEVASLCETWYQWLAARLLFQNPMVKAYELGLHAQSAVARFGGLSQMTSLDSVVLAAMEGDVTQVVNELVTTLDNLWFPAHLLDLLNHANQLDLP